MRMAEQQDLFSSGTKTSKNSVKAMQHCCVASQNGSRLIWVGCSRATAPAPTMLSFEPRGAKAPMYRAALQTVLSCSTGRDLPTLHNGLPLSSQAY